jgi:hypothetical protein
LTELATHPTCIETDKKGVSRKGEEVYSGEGTYSC